MRISARTSYRWAARATVLVLLLGGLTACSTGGGGGGGGGVPPAPPTPQPGAPTLTATVPVDNAIDVSVATPLRVTFSDAMNTASVEAAWSVDPAVTCAFAWSVGDTVVTCTPNAELLGNVTYEVEIGASARSAAGVTMGVADGFRFVTIPDVPPGATCTFPLTLGECRLGP